MKRRVINKHLPILILIVVNLSFAIFFGTDFNESWDEQLRYEVALEAIEHFKKLKPAQNISGKGPIYFMAAKLGGDLIQLICPSLTDIQAWHYVHFLTFILGVIAFYLISLRVLPTPIAFVSTVLFNTQPVLFGHAFINPKDIPFMSSFLLILATGLLLIEQLPAEDGPKSRQSENFKPWWFLVKEEWLALSKLQIIFLISYTSTAIVSLFLLLFQKDVVEKLLQQIINHIQQPILYKLVDFIAAFVYNGTISGGVTLENINRFYPILVAGGFIMLLGLMVPLLFYFPKSIKTASGITSKKQFSLDMAAVFKSGWIYPASIIFGLSVNNRSLSIAAGMFVILYLWQKNRRFFLPVSVVYLGLATFILYLSWPSLWGNPLTGVIKSLLENKTFSWEGKILFKGEVYKSESLPFYYLPYLMGIQFTLPAIALALFGLSTKIFEFKNKSSNDTFFFIWIMWFFFPLISALIVKPSIYDNFRHFLFITPPIFFFAGAGIKRIFRFISQSLIQLLITMIILIPGILGIVRLHPYQYIYYNQFIGGMKGAFRSYELDYWLTSYQEAVEYINQVASKNDVILVFGAEHLVNDSLRSDLKTRKLNVKNLDHNQEERLIQSSDYAIISSRFNYDLELFSDKPTVFSVEKNGVILSVVKEFQK